MGKCTESWMTGWCCQSCGTQSCVDCGSEPQIAFSPTINGQCDCNITEFIDHGNIKIYSQEEADFWIRFCIFLNCMNVVLHILVPPSIFTASICR